MVRELLDARDGMVAVVVADDQLERVRSAVEDTLGPADRERVAVHDPRTIKGLEFDDVVVVAPERIMAASSVGTHQLYVAVTRATRTLTLLASPDAQLPGAEVCDGE